MMKCYWLVKPNTDADKIIYTEEEHKVGDTVKIDGVEWRVIDKE